jgi:hypothetical protein
MNYNEKPRKPEIEPGKRTMPPPEHPDPSSPPERPAQPTRPAEVPPPIREPVQPHPADPRAGRNA